MGLIDIIDDTELHEYLDETYKVFKGDQMSVMVDIHEKLRTKSKTPSKDLLKIIGYLNNLYNKNSNDLTTDHKKAFKIFIDNLQDVYNRRSWTGDFKRFDPDLKKNLLDYVAQLEKNNISFEQYLDGRASTEDEKTEYKTATSNLPEGVSTKPVEAPKDDETMTNTGTSGEPTGVLGPHLKNTTESAVNSVLNKTPEQQIMDIKNWYIFDLPEYDTGVGSADTNILVKQNEKRELMLLAGDIFTDLNAYLPKEDITTEKQNFWREHPLMDNGAIQRGLKQIEFEREKLNFLQKFNDGSNGLFTNIQTKKELNDFKDQSHKSTDYYWGSPYSFSYPFNNGMTHTDTAWVNNPLIFVNP